MSNDITKNFLNTKLLQSLPPKTVKEAKENEEIGSEDSQDIEKDEKNQYLSMIHTIIFCNILVLTFHLLNFNSLNKNLNKRLIVERF